MPTDEIALEPGRYWFSFPEDLSTRVQREFLDEVFFEEVAWYRSDRGDLATLLVDLEEPVVLTTQDLELLGEPAEAHTGPGAPETSPEGWTRERKLPVLPLVGLASAVGVFVLVTKKRSPRS